MKFDANGLRSPVLNAPFSQIVQVGAVIEDSVVGIMLRQVVCLIVC
jgi:hypothetical protein